MQEITRLHYLRTLGITNYMPRWQLAAAPASVLNRDLGTPPAKPVAQPGSTAPAEPPAAGSASSSPAGLTSSNPAPLNPAAKAPIAELEALVEPSPTPQPVAPANGPEQPSGPADARSKPLNYQADKAVAQPNAKGAAKSGTRGGDKVNFALSFWRVSEDLMVVDSRHSELALPVEKLLNNILFALGYPRQLPKVDALSWPMMDAPHQDQGEDAARDTLHGFMDELFLLNPGKHILLMGEDASRYLLNHSSDFSEQLGKQFVIDEFGLTAIVVPSLSNILQDPSLKRVTWQAIQPLLQ
ncbi:hypothetical protein [Halioxenophilus aromaticivorans]|uniref:Uracil-DNA glycosylase-like domain-containing protein n=1 Tax=Halioxenophilus aromaticivorans TaxID=1306992 RepID=A0AAV3U0T1_9ALTE